MRSERSQQAVSNQSSRKMTSCADDAVFVIDNWNELMFLFFSDLH
jgi:hypothetical protein